MTKKRLLLTTIVFFALIFSVSVNANAQSKIEENALYWETSWDNGSGNHNSISKNNPYITADRDVVVNGYSFLNENGDIIKSEYDEDTQTDIAIPEAPSGTVKTMLHIHSLTNRLGWTDADNVYSGSVPTEKKTAEEFAEIISKKEGKTLIYVDKSASMDAFTEEATKAFNSLDLSDVTILVFSDACKRVPEEEINIHHIDMGGRTNIYGNLSLADEFMPNVKNVIIISDLADNHSKELKEIPSVETVEILCPDPNFPEAEVRKIKKSWKNATVNVSVIK